MERVVYTKEELKLALEESCETIVIRDEKLAMHVKAIKAASELLLYLGIAALIAIAGLGILSWTHLSHDHPAIKMASTTMLALWGIKILIVFVTLLFLETTLVYAIYREYDIKIGIGVEANELKHRRRDYDSGTTILKKRGSRR